MDTSDDSIFGGGTPDLPAVEAQNPSRTADRVDTVTGGVDRQKQLAASMITRAWDEPTLSNKGLLGL